MSDYSLSFAILRNIFNTKPTSKLAKEIWLFCHNTGFPVPDNVMNVFADEIRKQVVNGQTELSEKERKLNRLALITEIENEIIKEGKIKAHGKKARAIRTVEERHNKENDPLYRKDMMKFYNNFNNSKM